jgi:putative transposase
VASALATQAGTVLACDLLTVETAFLQRIYVLFFISLATRRIGYVACSSNPDGDWVARQGRNLMQLGAGQPYRFLIHDRGRRPKNDRRAIPSSPGFATAGTPARRW